MVLLPSNILGPEYKYHASLNRAVDGDTILADIKLGFYVTDTIRIRVRGVNTPELTSKDPDERKRARAAMSYLAATLASNPFLVESYKDHKSFDRWICDVYVLNAADGRYYNVADMIIDAGLGVYEGDS